MSIISIPAPAINPTSTRHGLRAPRGGCTVGGKRFRGGQFCRPYDVDNPHELPAVEIKGAKYLVQAIDAGECGVSAVRLVKLASRECYDVVRRHSGLVECDCPNFLFHHEGKGTTCKHGTAMMIRGLLPVAPAEGVNSTDTLPTPTDHSVEATEKVAEPAAPADRWTLTSPEGPAPTWHRPYTPTESDWLEYSEWSRSLDAGCGLAELTPDEMDLLACSGTDREYRELLQEVAFAEYDAARDAEECWS